MLWRIRREHLDRIRAKKKKKITKKGKKQRTKEEEDLVFVGIHCRRTDHEEIETRLENLG